MAFRAPVLGYNTNVRHKGKLYHIQTEDSGIDHPHVITHLFADGGRIVASKKTSYAERVGSDGLADLVKKLMQAQHKAMFIALRDGAYDEDGPNDAAVDQTGTHAIAPSAVDTPVSDKPSSDKPSSDKPSSDKPSKAQLDKPGAKPTEVTVPVELIAPVVDRASLYQGTQAAAEKPLPSKPPKLARSLFGGDLRSEKTLDEVILNYLAANDKES
jgi:hypothetical protein